MATRQKRSTRPVSETPPTPDTLKERGRVSIVVEMLSTIQAARFRLEVEQEANDLPDDALAPGLAVTIVERRDELARAEGRLAEKYSDLMPEVEKALGG